MTPLHLLERYGPRESMDYDVAVVGAGPEGLATAIRLKQLAAAADREVSVVVLERVRNGLCLAPPHGQTQAPAGTAGRFGLSVQAA
ncbi:hypothetical protein [uncultured Azohydromonas sp.]|jgi:Dehydrogenases (flavoproteins)|uniref:hypothetical protein n=1 Tax=uncultured Azohydromonas sp. TaxID=487342 RepID=UPI002611F828|nr:hypothetical protein [uncultured Azohydromonas sp.]